MNKRKNLYKRIVVVLTFSVTVLSFYTMYSIEQIDTLKLDLVAHSKSIVDTRDKNKKLKKENEELQNRINTGDFKSKVSFDTNNVLLESKATYEQLRYALRETKLVDYVDTFIAVENKYGINALFMVGIVANESSWLESNRTLTQNNVTGYTVYSDSSEGTTFESIDESILVTAQTLSEHYLNKDGKHHEGFSTYAVNKNYSSDKNWYNTVNSIAIKFKEEINDFADFLYQ